MGIMHLVDSMDIGPPSPSLLPCACFCGFYVRFVPFCVRRERERGKGKEKWRPPDEQPPFLLSLGCADWWDVALKWRRVNGWGERVKFGSVRSEEGC